MGILCAAIIVLCLELLEWKSRYSGLAQLLALGYTPSWVFLLPFISVCKCLFVVQLVVSLISEHLEHINK